MSEYKLPTLGCKPTSRVIKEDDVELERAINFYSTPGDERSKFDLPPLSPRHSSPRAELGDILANQYGYSGYRPSESKNSYVQRHLFSESSKRKKVVKASPISH